MPDIQFLYPCWVPGLAPHVERRIPDRFDRGSSLLFRGLSYLGRFSFSGCLPTSLPLVSLRTPFLQRLLTSSGYFLTLASPSVDDIGSPYLRLGVRFLVRIFVSRGLVLDNSYIEVVLSWSL